jgi:putative oxidoreductase
MTAIPTPAASNPARLAGLLQAADGLLSRTPAGLVSLVARVSIAAVFWKSGQTKIEGLAIDLVEGRFQIGLPRLSDGAVDLFRDEYRLPVLPPELAAVMAATAEHVFPVLLLVGLATRLSALALLVMTLVIQVFVYPGAYPIHGVWAAALLALMRLGAGPLSLDALIAGRHPTTGR